MVLYMCKVIVELLEDEEGDIFSDMEDGTSLYLRVCSVHVYYRYNKPLSYLIEIIVVFFMILELCWFTYRI